VTARRTAGPGPAPGAIAPVRDRAALALWTGAATTIVVSDLHLGLGDEDTRHGIPARQSAEAMADELLAILRTTGSQRLLIAGDVKHPIVGTPPRLRPVIFDLFARILGTGAEVAVVLGNHDVGLVRHLPREVEVHPSAGMTVGRVGIAHGHRWPGPRVLRSPTLVVGHLHPGVRLAPTADRPTTKERCWVRVARPAAPATGPRPRVGAREVIVLPPFNPLAGVESLNVEKPHRGRSFLFRRFLGDASARAYLLDGTDLGPLVTPSSTAATGAAGRSPRDR